MNGVFELYKIYSPSSTDIPFGDVYGERMIFIKLIQIYNSATTLFDDTDEGYYTCFNILTLLYFTVEYRGSSIRTLTENF